MDWDDKNCFRWFPYVRTSGDVLNNAAREVTCKKRMVIGIPVRK